jgi:tRNA(adenine34) deaminase
MNRKHFMILALTLAEKAYKKDEVPVGAIVVKDGEVIGKGFNQVIYKNSVVSHAEINAINHAGRTLKNYRLNNCDIYVTLEPCHMCAKAIVDARINHVYFAAREPKTGAVESIDKFFERDHLNHLVTFSGGHLEAESSKLLKSFFKSKRK